MNPPAPATPNIVHFVGVSVVEDRKSFQAPLRDWAYRQGLELHFSGFGGLGFCQMPHLLDLVAAHHGLEGQIVVLDVSSSRERDRFDGRRKRYDEAANDLLERIHHYRIRPIFLHLWRREINRESDSLREFLNEVAARNNIPVIDLVPPVFDYIDNGGTADDLFRDEVHTTPAGADFYGDLLKVQFDRILQAKSLAPKNLSPFTAAITLSASVQDGVRDQETRHNVNLPLVEMRDGREVEVALDGPVFLSAFLVFGNKDAGFVTVQVDDNPAEHEVACFDQFSYYPHIYVAPVGVRAERRVRIRALDKRPAEDFLVKGVWSDGPRVSLISHLFVRPETGEPDNPAEAPATGSAPATRPARQIEEVELERYSARLGIDPRHIRPPKAAAERMHFGVQRIVAQCVHYNPFREETLPGGIGQDIARNTLRLYALPQWQKARDKGREAFFAGGRARYHSPLDGAKLLSLGSIFGRRFDYHLLDGPHLRILLTLGASAYAIYYPDRNVMVHLTAYEEHRAGILQPLVALLLGSWRGVEDWIAAADRSILKRSFVIADNRPAHFLTQTLGFVDSCWPVVERFQADENLVAVARDWCFVDPVKVFPALRKGPLLSARSDQLTQLCLDMRLSMQRVARVNAFKSVEWVKRVAPNTGEASADRPFTAWIAIDAEKERFLNQVPALAALIDMLGQGGRPLKIIWDGWTAIEGQWSEKDQRIVDRIDAITAEIAALASTPFEQDRIYGRTFEYKLSRTAHCDLALATHGTASIMPSIIRKVPTITYHVPKMLALTGYAEDETWFPVAQEGIAMGPVLAKIDHEQAFTVTPDELIAAAERALARH